jgi:uncharacterized membrane protein
MQFRIVGEKVQFRCRRAERYTTVARKRRETMAKGGKSGGKKSGGGKMKPVLMPMKGGKGGKKC